MKKKLLVFHPIIAPYRIDFFNALNKAFDMKLYMFQENLSDNKFDYDEILKQLDFKPEYLTSNYQVGPIKIRKGILKQIQTFDPDIVLVPECGYASILSVVYKKIRKKRYKVVSIIDDSYDMAVNGKHFSKKHELAEKILIPMFDNIITVEPDVTNYFIDKYSKGIYFPIIKDENKAKIIYHRSFPISEQYVETYGLKDKKVLLYVGRLIELKNVQRVIRTFNKIKGENLRFVIVGSGLYEDTLKSLAEEDNRIIFAGRLEGDSLYAWYNVANAFILASYQESFGAVTNEALLGGCTALISSKAGSRCLVEEDVNGNTFNPYDEEEILHVLTNTFQKEKHITLPLSLRENKMKIKFDDCFSDVVNALNE